MNSREIEKEIGYLFPEPKKGWPDPFSCCKGMTESEGWINLNDIKTSRWKKVKEQLFPWRKEIQSKIDNLQQQILDIQNNISQAEAEKKIKALVDVALPQEEMK